MKKNNMCNKLIQENKTMTMMRRMKKMRIRKRIMKKRKIKFKNLYNSINKLRLMLATMMMNKQKILMRMT